MITRNRIEDAIHRIVERAGEVVAPMLLTNRITDAVMREIRAAEAVGDGVSWVEQPKFLPPANPNYAAAIAELQKEFDNHIRSHRRGDTFTELSIDTKVGGTNGDDE